VDQVVDAPPAGCLLLDKVVLRQTGSIALELDQGGIKVIAARRVTRIWSGRPMADGLLPETLSAKALKVTEQPGLVASTN
jgi:hypothetical protein